MSIETQISRLNNIIEKIILRISIKNGLKDYFFNHLCEDIFTVTFSEYFGGKFTNINIEKPNAPGIDLICKDLKVCIQISSSGTPGKLYNTLRKFLKQEEYKDYEKLYFFIIGEKEESFFNAQKLINEKILLDESVKLKEFKFDVENDIIELKKLSELINIKYSNQTEGGHRELSLESINKIVDDLSNSIEGFEFVLKSITEIDKNDYLKNNCLEITKSINRRLIDEENNIFSEEDLTIKDELKYTFIYGDAGIGKTHLLNKLSFELFEKSTKSIESTLPFIINLKNITFNISLEKQLPQHFGKRFKSILIFDGYDEITIREQSQFKSILIQYLELNKFTSCIIGSRTKIKKDEISFCLKNDFNNRKYSFKTLKIDFFNENEIIDFITSKEIEVSFFREKNYTKIHSDLKNPYYLDLITNYYKDYGNLPDNKLIVLDKLVNRNLIRLTSENNRMLAMETRHFLEKITFIFYFTENKVLKDMELARIIKYKNEIWELLSKHNSLIFSEIYEHWEISLSKQKELDFLFYSLLKKMNPKTLFEIFKEDIILPDTWYNSLLLFNDDNEINHEVRNEMTKKFPFIYIKEFQSNPNDSLFTNELRTKVFQEIFNKYEEKDIWIDFKVFDEKSYVDFGDINENFNFLISKVSSENQRTKNKSISLLRKFQPSKERIDLLLPILKNEIVVNNDKNTIWEIYYCLSNYKDFIGKTKQKDLINLSVKSKIDFLKYNEYVRSSVYNFILVCNLQDFYIDYLFEGIEILRFHNRSKIKGRSGTNLLDEGFNLDNLFFNLKTKTAIAKSFNIFFNNYRSFDDYHGKRIFENLILKATDILKAKPNENTFKQKLISVFSKYDCKNENWFYWREMIIDFNLDKFIIKTLKSENEVINNLIDEKKIFGKHFLSSAPAIAKLLTENNYINFINSLDQGLISLDEAIRIYEFVDERDKELSNKIKSEIIKRGGNIESNYKIKSENLNEEQRDNFELLFNGQKFKKQVLSFFGRKKKIKLPWDKVPEWYDGNLFFNGDIRIEYLRLFVDYKNDYIIEKIKVSEDLTNNLEMYLVEQIFDKKIKLNYEFSSQQFHYLENWIKKQVLKLDFRSAIHNVKNNSFSINQDCLTTYKYISELNLKLDKKTNLDLLSFIDINHINDSYEDYFKKIVNEIDDFDAVKKRINENLKLEIKYSSILNNHIIFSYEYNITENYLLIEKLLIKILPELKNGHYNNNPIIIYYDKSKNFEFIKKYFPTEINDLFWIIIDYLIENNEYIEFVESKLLLHIDKTENWDEKLKFSSRLIKINSKNSLERFYNILFEIKEKELEGQFRLYDHKESIHKFKNDEVETAVKLLELTFKFNFDNFDSPRREVSAYLKRMIIDNKDNYDRIKTLIKTVIKSNIGKINNIQFLEYELDDFRETFYSNYKSNYSLKDALEIISEIDK